ncbi:hypothetical protein OIM90_26495 [Streptomyces sp. AD16]|nr:hypothetical protein OIM90_26495 [Streptomyces sp. AD16]
MRMFVRHCPEASASHTANRCKGCTSRALHSESPASRAGRPRRGRPRRLVTDPPQSYGDAEELADEGVTR